MESRPARWLRGEQRKSAEVSWNDVKEKYLEFHKMDSFTENMAIDIDFGYWLVSEYASQSDYFKVSDEEIKKTAPYKGMISGEPLLKRLWWIKGAIWYRDYLLSKNNP